MEPLSSYSRPWSPEEQEQHESKKKKQRRDVSSETLTLCDTAENEYFYFNTLAKSSIA